MRRFLNKKAAVPLIICLAAALLIVPHMVGAQSTDTSGGSILGSIGNAILNALTGGVGKIAQAAFEIVILPLASAVMWLCGSLLDSAIKLSIGTGYVFDNMAAVNVSWSVVRDFCNIFFIFSLIWISISTIVGVGNYNAKKKLTQVIIAAIIINFSLFFTKLLVDASNVIAAWLYNGIMTTLSGAGTGSLSALITDRLGILNYWGLSAVTNLIDPTQGLITAVMRLLVALTATYVFMYTAILFITRAVTVLFLLVFSPVGFMSEVLPQLAPYSKDWREELTKAITFPIVYLLMLYVTVQFINTLDTGFASLSSILGTQTKLLGIDPSVVFKYVIVISMLFACLKVAKDSSGALGKMADKLAGGISRGATAIGGGATALAGQYTVGLGASKLANNRQLNELIARGGIGGAVGSSVKSGLSNISDFHFDPRTMLNIGVKPGKGYKTRMKEMEKDEKEALEAIAPTEAELAPARDELDKAEHQTYLAHPTMSAEYERAHANAIEAKTTLETALPEEKRLREAQRARVRSGGTPDKTDEDKLRSIRDDIAAARADQKELENVRTKIQEDDKTPGWKFNAQLHEQKKARLADVTARLGAERDEVRKAELAQKQAGIEASMRQEEAIRGNEQGKLVSIATKVAKKPWAELSTLEKILMFNPLTPVGLLKFPAQQYLDDVKKRAKTLRSGLGKDSKDEKKRKEMFRLLSGDTAPSTPTPPPPAPPTPPTP